MSGQPRWLRLERKRASSIRKSRQATGGCTCLTKELFPSDWARFMLPWFLTFFFAGTFIWVRGWGWVSRLMRFEISATLASELSFVSNALLVIWSLAMVHYYSPGFPPQALTARAIAIDLDALEKTGAATDGVGSASSEYHWELKKYGVRMGELRTCKRSPPLQLAPLGTIDTVGSSVCPVKPDRAHFCPFTGRAVMEMDHYCPWLGNCIGFGTRKPFMLTLWYGVMMGFSFVGSISWDLVIAFTTLNRFIAAVPLLLAMVLGVLALFLVTLFFQYHLLLILGNRTTIEDHEKRRAPQALGVEKHKRVNIEPLFTRDENSDAFRRVVHERFESEKPAKNSLFATMWSAWAYRTSPWDHGFWGNMCHYMGPITGWLTPMHTGWTRWRPWSISLRPVRDDSTLALAKGAAKTLHEHPGLGPRDPVGVAPHALVPREALVHAARIKRGMA